MLRGRITQMGIAITFALTAAACGGTSTDSVVAPVVAPVATIPAATPTSADRFVTVGFWQEPTCSGAPGNTAAFPVSFGNDRCFSWPGRSGENSASQFSCGSGTMSYTQWTTLTCSGGQVPAGTRKTVTLTGCTQGVPPTQYMRIIDNSGCAGSTASAGAQMMRQVPLALVGLPSSGMFFNAFGRLASSSAPPTGSCDGGAEGDGATTR